MAPDSTSSKETALQPTDASTRKDVVAQALRDAIVSGRLPPGSPLNESRLAEQLQVSRSPLREAIRQLAEEGLVRTVSYKGSWVAEIDAKFVEELYGLRVALEEFGMRQLMARGVPSLAPLEKVVGEMERAARRENRSQLVELDLKFHRTLLGLAGNALLSQHWERLSNHTRRCINTTAGYRRDLSQITENHRQLISVIEEGPVERAALVLREHIAAAGEGLRQWLAAKAR